MTTDLFGQDIALDSHLQPQALVSGELLLCDGTDTGVQDIALRLLTPLGSLFYDREYGSRLYELIHEDAAELLRISVPNEIKRRIEADPRVVLGSVSCTVTSQLEIATIQISWRFIDEGQPSNLVLQHDKKLSTLVVADAAF